MKRVKYLVVADYALKPGTDFALETFYFATRERAYAKAARETKAGAMRCYVYELIASNTRDAKRGRR